MKNLLQLFLTGRSKSIRALEGPREYFGGMVFWRKASNADIFLNRQGAPEESIPEFSADQNRLIQPNWRAHASFVLLLNLS
jgi:hypothetical protein